MPLIPVSEFDPVETEAETTAEALNDHPTVMAGRLIERWKEKPNLLVMLESLADEVQELEDAVIGVLLGRLPDFATGVQLDMLGRVVGQPREGLSDDRYRVHINARIAINQSFGRPEDLIGVIRILSTAEFLWFEPGFATLGIAFTEPLEASAVGREIPKLLKQTRAAGVRLLVTMPVNRETPERNALFGSKYAPTLNVARGTSSAYDSTVGGLFGHAAEA